MGRGTKQCWGLKGMLLQGPLWAQLMSSLLLLRELVLIPPRWCLWLNHPPRTLMLSQKELEWKSDQRWVFSNGDKIRTIQLHDDTLVVILKIGWYDVKRVLVDQGNRAEIMYPDLYKGLNLKPEDLTTYDSPWKALMVKLSFQGVRLDYPCK